MKNTILSRISCDRLVIFRHGNYLYLAIGKPGNIAVYGKAFLGKQNGGEKAEKKKNLFHIILIGVVAVERLSHHPANNLSLAIIQYNGREGLPPHLKITPC